jgi:ABC-type polysaccharide/polyol phosphate export permease
MVSYFVEFARSKDLIKAWTGRIIRGRYQQSALGWLWAVIQPAASAAIFTLIFTRFVRIDTGDIPYVIFSYAGIVDFAIYFLDRYVNISRTKYGVSNQDLLSP